MTYDHTDALRSPLSGWPDPLFEKPPVRIDGNGVSHVDPRDILLSLRGQEEITKAMHVMSRDLCVCHACVAASIPTGRPDA